MAKIVASPDITILDFSVLFNISLATPSVTITNLSTVITAANLQWAFEFRRPGGFPIHVGNFTTPDVDGVPFATFTFSEPIPQLFRQIEYSNIKQYTVKVLVKDSNDDIFDLTKGASLCKPNGNTGKNNFGAANIEIEPQCALGRLYVKDMTNLVYKAITGTKVSTTVELTPPMDDGGNQPVVAPVGQLPCLLPITSDGEGYNIYVAHVFDYDLGDGFVVRVRYSYKNTFPVWCNVTLQPLFCEIDKINNEFLKNCDDTVRTRELAKQLIVVNTKMLKAHTGIVQPLSKFDVPKIIAEIKEILGVECECCRPAGINNIGTMLFADAIITPNKVCGDMLISWEDDGEGNVSLNYQNKTYTFSILGSDAFGWKENQVSCNLEEILVIDIETLAEEFLTEIANNPTLLNILNSITQRALLTCSGLNGGDNFDLSTCNFSVELTVGGLAPTVVNIIINGTTYAAPGGTLVSAASTIQTWLNGLALGVFVVNYSVMTGKTTITSANNENSISTITTNNGTSNNIKLFNSDCGLICNILQKILTWANDINVVQIAGTDVTICRFNSDGTVLSTVFTEDDKLSDILIYMADSLCNVANYLKDKLLSCANIKAMFAAFTSTTGNPNGADIFLMIKGGACQQVTVKSAAIAIIKQIIIDDDVKDQFCLISPCSTVNNCSPVEDLTPSLGTDTTQTFNWSAVAGAVGYKWSIDGVNYTNVISTTAFVSGLTADTSYTFRVYPVYPFGNGTACEITSNFITTNTGDTCAAPGNLVLDTITDTSFRASWDTVIGATGYQYRLNGGGWINAGLVLIVTPSGLTPDTDYNFEVRAIIGGTPCPDSTDDDMTTETSSADNVSIANNTAAASLSGTTVGGSPYFTSPSSFPLAPANSLFGEHTGFGGVIKLNMSGITVCSATITVNGVFWDCIDLVNGSANDFATKVYLVTDQIAIIIIDGAC